MVELNDLLSATRGQLHGERYASRFTELAFDSRRIEPRVGRDTERLSRAASDRSAYGPLFVAVKSDTGDGHDYILDALRRGATGVLCQRVPPHLPSGVTCLLVQDTRRALLDWARYILDKYGPQVIGVTGSSGKTTTRRLLASIVGVRHASVGSSGLVTS